MSGFAVAATKSGDGVIHACVVKSGEEKGVLRVVNGSKCPKGQRSISFNQTGPVGPAGPAGPAGTAGERGAAGAAATNQGLPPLEAVHFIGAPGEPGFEIGAGNMPGTTRTGFYKDQSGIVHVQGEVSAGVGPIFYLPPGYRPADGFCAAASAYNSVTVLVFNRVCVSPSGSVNNGEGGGTKYISLNALSFRSGN